MPVREDVLIVVTVQGGQVSVQTLKNVQNQLSKLTGTAAQVAAQFQQALSRLTIPNSVLRSNQQGAQQITLNAGQAAAALQRQAQAAQQAAQAQAQAATSGRQAATAANTLAGGVNAQAEVQKRANLLLIDFSRFAQDAAFGIRAVINNIDPLVLNSERFTAAVSAATGGTATFNNILKSLFATLRGPGGVLVLVAVVFALQELTGLFTPIVNGFKSLAAGLKGVGDPAAKFNEEVGEMVESLLELDERLDLDDAIEDLDQLNE